MIDLAKYFRLFIVLILLMSWYTHRLCGQANDRRQLNFKKIDVHAHYEYDRGILIPILNEWKMKALLVDVFVTRDTGINREWAAYKNLNEKFPNHFYLCSAFDADGIDEPEYAEIIIKRLSKEIKNGASLIKVWKNFGMISKDNEGSYIQIDDPRLQPIWDYLIKNKIPVMAHIGEPIQAWRPIVEGKPHAYYYKTHPEYHAYQHPEIPQWDTIIAARDHWVENNPGLTILGAHMGSMSHDVDLVAVRLDKYPNFYVETAARWGDLQEQDKQKIRQFFIKYQDRILYGTDIGISKPLNEVSKEQNDSKRDRVNDMFESHWQYLTKDLSLPDSVLRKVYYKNAVKILGLSK